MIPEPSRAVQKEFGMLPVSNSIIESIGVYLPETVVTTEEIVKGCARPLQFPLEELTGIESRRMAGESEFSVDLARKAVSDCLSHSKYAPRDLELLICAHISRYDAPRTVTYEPSTAMVLKKDFGFSRAVAFDVTNACAGMFTAIVIVHDLLQCGQIRSGMVVSGEYITHLTKTAQQEIDGYMDPQLASLTVGDAGAAIVMERAPSNDVGFHVIDLYTLAQYCPLCVAKPADGSQSGTSMITDSIRATAAVVEHTTKTAAHVMRKSPLPLESFQHVIPHQTSKTSIHEGLSEVARLFGRNLEALVINNVRERGNTASNTHVVAVKDHIDNNTIKSGDSAMFCFSGSGITVGTALYTFDDLPDRLAHSHNGNGSPKPKTAAVQVPAFIRLDDAQRVRIESVGVSRPGQNGTTRNTHSMLADAAKMCIRASSHKRRDLHLVMHVGVYRTEFITEPAIAVMTANDLKINLDSDPEDDNRTLAFDLMNGSAGFLDACYVAAGMIRNGRAAAAMILASEVENNVDANVPGRRGLCETASAVVIDRDPESPSGFRSFFFKDYPQYLDRLHARAVADQGTTKLEWEQADDLADRYVQCITESVRELLDRERLDGSQIAAVLPPQMGSALIDRLSDQMQIDRRKFVDVGHHDLFTSSIPFAMDKLIAEGQTRRGDLGLIINIGAGIHVGCAVYQF